MAAYRRVLVKLSGEALMGEAGYGIEPARLDYYAAELQAAGGGGVQLGVVIGGGNIFRGVQAAAGGFDRVTADHMGMLATVLNGLALAEALRARGTAVAVHSGLPLGPVAQAYVPAAARRDLEAGRLVLCVGGTGNPFFSTDTAAGLRAAELGADLLVKATKVDGVYDADPLSNPGAKRYDVLAFNEVLHRELGVMDAAAVALCRDNGIPVRVCDVNRSGNLRAVVAGQPVGTLINREGRA